MNKKRFFIWHLIIFLHLSPVTLSAQETGKSQVSIKIPESGYTQIITTRDGSTYIGKITRIGINDIDIATDIGSITIPLDKISGIREIPETSLKEGKVWFPDPNTTRLFFSPTGRMLKKHTGYFADYYLFFPNVNYGITDRFSLGGGLSLIPSGNFKEQVYYFTPKYGLIQKGKTSVAVGALMIQFPKFDNNDNSQSSDDVESPLVSVLYGTGTYGSQDKSVTVAVGYGFVDSKPAEKPMIVLGGEKRLTRGTAFITENWIIPGVPHALVSYGVRFFGEKLSVDLGFISPTGNDWLFPGIPWIDFVYNF